MFVAVSEALCYQEYGQLDAPRREGWEPIIHHDLKADNIFLATPDSYDIWDYPAIKVADYGKYFSTIIQTSIHTMSETDEVWSPGNSHY